MTTRRTTSLKTPPEILPLSVRSNDDDSARLGILRKTTTSTQVETLTGSPHTTAVAMTKEGSKFASLAPDQGDGRRGVWTAKRTVWLTTETVWLTTETPTWVRKSTGKVPLTRTRWTPAGTRT